MPASAEPTVRRARPEDARAVADLLYESSAEMWDRYAGDRDRTVRILLEAFDRPGTSASRETITVAVLDGEVAAAIAAFPVSEAAPRARRFLRVTIRRLPPPRWAAALRVFHLAARAAPPPPPGSLYVDALASAERHRRRGAATALLHAAEESARDRHLTSIALETELDNARAKALYRSAGLRPAGERPPTGGLPGFVAFVKELRG